MYAGETYVMQIDAHLIFAENWDVDIVRMHTEMKNTHIVLSSYLSGLTKYIKSDGSRMIPKTIPLTCHFDVEKTSLGMVVPKAQPEVLNPIPGSSVGPVPFIAAGFSFAIGQFFLDVPYDPHLPQIFHGEEFDWSVRAFTHGYDVYNPSTSVCFHNYTRGNVVIMFDDPHWSERKHIEMRSRRRILYKMGVRTDFRPRLDFDEAGLRTYGVGDVRSPKSYFDAFGFEVENGKIIQTIDSTTRCKRLRETPRRGGLLHNAQREVDGDPRGITTSHLRDTFRGFTSDVVIIDSTAVSKKYKHFGGELIHLNEFNFVERELCVLRHLQRFPWAPKVVSSTKQSITMSYVGHPVTKSTLPRDYRAQFNKILADLKSVDVQHNDIVYPCSAKKNQNDFIKHEVMVLDGRLSLVDFGWATIHGTVPCNFSIKTFPSFFRPCPDSKMLDVLDVMGGTQHSFMPYRDPKRSMGSQSETPSYTIATDKSTIRVRGYQQFDLKERRVTTIHNYPEKFDWIRRTIRGIRASTRARTFMDIGCSAGLTSLLAREAGYTDVYSLDHDSEYIAMLQKIVTLIEQDTAIHPAVFSFGDVFPIKADVVFVGALIHWVFTCTANFGRFDAILDYIATAVKKVLVIEWVDPHDPAIVYFDHPKCGATPQESYDVAGFEEALRRVGTITDRWPLPGRPTRVLYAIALKTSEAGLSTTHEYNYEYSSPFIFGYDSCPHFRAYANAPVLGPAGLFNTGTNYLAELLRINCERTDSEIPVSVWQVPWGKHNPPEWHRWNHETSTSHMQNIMPVVTIKNPLTWMKSMCRHPYAVALKGKCPSSVEKTENVVTYGGGRERTYTSLLHLWAEWYRAYFETKMPHLIVRYEDLLFHPSETVSKICKCVGGTMRKGSFKNINKSAKSGKGHGWGGNGRATALALHRDAAKRVEGYSLEDLLFVRNNENAYRLMRLFNYSHDLTIETTAATRIFKPFNARFVEARMRSVPDKIDVRHLVKLVQRTRPGVPSFPPAPLPASELEELCVGRQNDADGRLLQRVTVASAAEVNAAEKRAVHLRSSHGVAHSSTMLYSRILCVVYCTQSDHDEKIGAIRDTWANRCDGFAAMSTATDPELPSLKVPHEGKEEYHNIWQKMRSIFILLYRRYYDDFEWFTIGGSDLYVVVENLRLYLNSDEIVNATRGPDGRAMPFYLGRRFALDGDRTRMFNSGGAGYVLNRAALKILAENVLDNPVCELNAHTSAEDVQVAKCLKRAAGVLPHDTRDNFGRERFHPFTPGKHLSYRVPPDGNDWYAKYAIDLTFGEACCSERSISFHCSGTFKQLRYALESLQFALENSHYWKPSMLGSSIHIPCEVPFDDIFDLAELERAFPLTVLNKSASTTTPLLHVDCMGDPTTCVHDPELWSNIIQATRPSAPLRRVAGEIVQELPSKFVCIHARIEDDFKSVFEGTYRYKTVVQIRNMVRNYDFGDIETLYIAGGDVFDLAQWYDIGFAEIRHKNRTVKSMLEGSVIDMEVCKHAEVHVGTAGSIWDEFLHEWRYVNGRLSTLMYAADRPVVGLEPFVGANDEVHLIRSSNLRTKPYHSLETLFGESGSDKARYGNGKGYHGYTCYYERIFTAIRTDAVRLLEIGVATGHSMKVWQQYFVNAEHVYGIGFGNFQSTPSQECSTNAATKVDTQVPCTIFKGDQSDQSFLNHFVSETGGMFDIIIDDGSHVPSHQLLSFETLWPSVKPGGMYIVEDIETNWWKPSAKIYGYTLNNQPNVVDKWKGLVETLNREFTNGRSPLTDENLAVYGSIASVEFGQNIIIFYKVLQGEERFLSKPYRFKRVLVDQ
eukprot:g4281.t1